MTPIELQAHVSTFHSLFNDSMTNMAKACKIYYDTVCKDRPTAAAFAAKCPYISDTKWDRIYMVGAGAYDVRILFLGDHTAKKLEKFSIDKQREICSGPIKVNESPATGGKVKVTEKRIEHMNATEVDKTIRKDGTIRTPAEQHVEFVLPKHDKSLRSAFVIDGHGLRILRATYIPITILEAIVKKIRALMSAK